MSLQNLIVKFQEKGFKELDSKITQIQNKTKNVDIKEPQGLNKFSSGLDVAKGKLNSLIPGINKASLGFAGLAVAMGAVVQRLYSMTKQWSADTEAKMLNAQASGLAMESFQALEQAGKEYNFTQQDIIAGMARLRMQAKKTGDTRETSDMLRDVANQMNNATSEAEKLQIASDNFGRTAGPKMASFLGQGEEALDDYIKRTEKIRIDEKTMGAVNKFQSIMNDAGLAMEGIKMTFMKDIIEPMITFAEQLWEMIIPFLEDVMLFVEPIVRVIMFVINLLLKVLAPVLQVISASIGGIGLILDMIVTGLEMIISAFDSGAKRLIEWLRSFKIIKKVMDTIANTWDKLFGKGSREARQKAKEELAEDRDSYGFGRPIRTPMIRGITPGIGGLDTMDDTKPGTTGTRGGGSGTPEMVAILIHFKNEFIMFARRLLAIQEHGRTLTGRTVASNANIALTVNVDATGAGSPGAVGQAVADNVQAVLRDILTSNRQAVTAIQNHEQTVKDITTTKPDERQARLTPSINPVMQPLG